MLRSHYRDLGNVRLPPSRDRQLYMHTFNTACIRMPSGYEEFGPVAETLCRAAGYQGEAHLTVDEKIVQAGWSQRRPGAHVDGYYIVSQGRWGHPNPGPAWLHYCNRLPVERMPIIVAADVPGCIAYPGRFDGMPAEDGDLEHIRMQLGHGELLPGGRAFWLSPDCVHESMRFASATRRSFIRIALGAGRCVDTLP